VCVSFSTFFSFLPIIQTYSAHLSFFTLFSVSRHIPGYTVFVPHFETFCLFVCLFFHHILCPTMCISHFSYFSTFLCHISCSKVCVSQFPRFSIFSPSYNPKVSISHFSHSSLFFAKFQVLQCVFLIVNVFQCFSPYSSSYSVYFLFFHVFHCFSPYSIIYSVCVSISTFFIFFMILLVLHCVFLIFHINEWFSPHSRSNSVCVPFSMFFSGLSPHSMS